MTASVIVRGVRVVEPGGRVGPATAVLLEDGRVRAVGADVRGGARAIELDGLWLGPGLIDLQVNGAAGHDLTADPSSVWAVGVAVAATGVAAFLPTLVTAPLARTDEALAILAAGPPHGYRGAQPLGLHVEGPFLSRERHGAHDPELLRDPDPAAVEGWSRRSGVAMVTLAPELPGALDAIRALAGRRVAVSLGHSNATYEEARAGIDAGARYATHLFNAMPGLHHRDPGIVGAVLADERVTVGTIPAGIHLHPAVLDLAWRICGPDRLSVVTDAMAAVGMGYGTFLLGDREVTVDDTGPRLPDGLLAGSVLTLDAAVRNLAAATGQGLETAVATATTVPARLLGLTDRGRIVPGARADLTLLTPAFEPVATLVAGRFVWTAPAIEAQVSAWV